MKRQLKIIIFQTVDVLFMILSLPFLMLYIFFNIKWCKSVMDFLNKIVLRLNWWRVR